MKFFILIMVLVICFMLCHASNILVLSPVASKSHKISVMPIVRALARNHHVTIVTSHSQEEVLENVHDIVVPNPYMNDGNFDWFAMNSFNPFVLQFHIFNNFATISKFNYEALMNNSEFLYVLKSREIDLVILDDSFNDFCLKIIEDLQVPFVYFSSSTGYPWIFNSMGVSQELSSVPSRFTGYDSTMDFKQRLFNTLAGLGAQILRRFIVIPAIDAYTKKDFPLARSISDIEKEASLYFLSSLWATTWPRSVPPTVIQLGPLHIRPAQPLPQVMCILFRFKNYGQAIQILNSRRSIVLSRILSKTVSFSSLWDRSRHPNSCRKNTLKLLLKSFLKFPRESSGSGMIRVKYLRIFRQTFFWLIGYLSKIY